MFYIRLQTFLYTILHIPRINEVIFHDSSNSNKLRRSKREHFSLGYALYKGIPYAHDVDYMTGSNSDEFIGTKKLLAGNLSWARIHTSPNGKPFFHYYFTHALPDDEEGAFHSAELWYTFGTIKRCWRPLTEADSSLSQVMLDYWTSFAKYGVPKAASLKPWTPYTKDTPLSMCFHSDSYGMESLEEDSEIQELIKSLIKEVKE